MNGALLVSQGTAWIPSALREAGSCLASNTNPEPRPLHSLSPRTCLRRFSAPTAIHSMVMPYPSLRTKCREQRFGS